MNAVRGAEITMTTTVRKAGMTLAPLAPFRFVTTAAEAPAAAGAYVLAIDLSRPAVVRIGSASATLGPGRYLYCGSAKGPGGLRARLARHMRRRKSVRWHVDQLTTRGDVPGAWVALDHSECELADALVTLASPVPGFGSTDCRRCIGHLLAWPA